MRARELEAFGRTHYLNDGHPHVLDEARPLFAQLLSDLAALPEEAPEAARLAAFESCVLALNDMGDEIETVERECFCAALYDIGAIVDLDPDSEFVDHWRGDW